MKRLNAKMFITVLVLILTLAGLVPVLSGCAGSVDVDTSGMCLVVYDGNGGYLGNKTAQVRKFYTKPGNKIPDYPTDYTENQYTVSSLGLAMREGYNLLGWYVSNDAKYETSETGEYVYLSAEDGNGVYEINPEGEYVLKYEKAASGEFVFVSVEESEGEEDTYVFINNKYVVENDAEEPSADETAEELPEDTAADTETIAEEETDNVEETDNADAVTEETAETEDNIITLSVESGFYVCNGDETINDIDDDYLREAYRSAYEKAKYSKNQISGISGWQKASDLPAAFRDVLEELDRYAYAYVPAEDGDEELEHYSVESGYASLYSIFVENEKGEYIFESPYYVEYNEEDPAHQSKQRFAVNSKYVYSGNPSKPNASYLERFDATMDYWDFANNKVTEDLCVWDGEKYVLTLNAHWVKKNTVYYHYENVLGQVDESWTRLLSDNITYVPIKSGEVIGKKEIIPLNAGYTFVCWSKTQGEYDPWDFENDLFPDNETELHLYAYYIEGTYTRIVSASGLTSVGKNPDGNYLLVNNIDLGGKEVTTSPLGLKADQVFTGEFVAFDKTISNFTYKISPSKTQSIDSSVVVMGCLFPQISGAKISGLSVECSAVFSGGLKASKTSKGKTDINFAVSGIAGTVLDTSEISSCNVKLSMSEKTEGALKSDAYTYVVNYGAFSAYPANGKLKLSGNNYEIDNALEESAARLQGN